MAQVYFNMVIKNKISVDSVPLRWRDAVMDLIQQNTIEVEVDEDGYAVEAPEV